MDVDQARSVLPQALYLPPAQAGDVLRVLRLKPVAIVILDGRFESTAAVWHKEIAIALQKGVPVIGAASMGALRAAEMQRYGMTGIGKIYEDYLLGRLEDDDEVALIHAISGEPLSDPMVSIRATVEKARSSGILSDWGADAILTNTKEQFYSERSLKTAIEAVRSTGVNPTEIEEFAIQVSREGLVDQKNADALAALSAVGKMSRDGSWPLLPRLDVPKTKYIQHLEQYVACQPFCQYLPEIPLDERVASVSRFLGESYIRTKQLAHLCAVLTDIAASRELKHSDVLGAPLVPDIDSSEWRSAADLDEAEAASLKARVKDFEALEALALNGTEPKESSASHHIAWLIETRIDRYTGWLSALRRVDDGADHKNLFAGHSLFARLWRILDRLCETARMDPPTEELQAFADQWRRTHGLVSVQLFHQWLEETGFSQKEYTVFIRALFRYAAVVDNRLLHYFGVRKQTEGVFWLVDALRLTNQYPEAKKFLYCSPEELRKRVVVPSNDEEAYACDFEHGRFSAELELRNLAGVRDSA